MRHDWRWRPPLPFIAEIDMKSRLFRLYAFITREHTIEISAERLTRLINRHGLRQQVNVTEPIDKLSLSLAAGSLTLSGRFEHSRWPGRFRVRLQPTHVIWETHRHVLGFKLIDHTVQFDRSVRGALAAIGLAVVNGLLGKNYMLGKTFTALDGDQVLFELDHLDPKIGPLLEALTLHRIECIPDALRVHFSTHPRQVLRSAGRLTLDWLDRRIVS